MAATKLQRRVMKVPGFQLAGVACGLKKRPLKDVALIYSEAPAVVAGTFTDHPAAAAPVQLSRRVVRNGKARAVVINSGNANACTGRQGREDAQAMARETAQALQVPIGQVLVCSTGTIGIPLSISKIKRGIRQGARQLDSRGGKKAAEAILTTDRTIKVAAVQGEIGGKPYRLWGMAKGAGMIEPHMEPPHATMLTFILTDAALDRRWARLVLQEAVEQSFNRISVDGDTSTNDTCLLLANGLAENAPLRRGQPGTRSFAQALTALCSQLALDMVADGEGATKVVTIRVQGVKTQAEAKRLAYGIANSQLVRTSFYGADPNWGRVVTALGNSGATDPPSKVDISYGGVCVCRKGVAVGSRAERQAQRKMRGRQFDVTVDCHAGPASHDILSSDLSLDYVTLNSRYRS